MYFDEVCKRLSSAPINLAKGSAAKNITVPIITDAIKIKTMEHEKILLAVVSSFLPSAIEIGTDAPTPTRSASEKFIITRGIAILTAAKATSPNFCPINTPSMMLYIDIANILIIPGNATVKNSLHGDIVANIVFESIFIFLFPLKVITKNKARLLPRQNTFRITGLTRHLLFEQDRDRSVALRCSLLR